LLGLAGPNQLGSRLRHELKLIDAMLRGASGGKDKEQEVDGGREKQRKKRGTPESDDDAGSSGGEGGVGSADGEDGALNEQGDAGLEEQDEGEGVAGSDSEGEDEGDGEGDDDLLNPLAKGQRAPRKRKFVKLRTKRSLGHFLVESQNGTVKCVLCAYKPAGMRPDNIVRHWKAHHAKHFEAVEAANDSGRDVRAVVDTLRSAATPQKGAIDGYVKHKPRLLLQTPKIMKEVVLLRWLISSKLSFNSLETEEFRDLLEEWNTVLESKSTMLNLLTPLFEHVLSLTEKALAELAGIACTFDLWTSSAGRKYLAVTYHGIDKNWRLFHCVLDVIRFRGSTQSEVIAAVVRNCIEKHLPKEKLVTVVVSDGAGDAKHAREDLLEFDGHDCFNHDLNLSLGDAVKLAKAAGIDFATMEHLIREIESDKNLKIFFENMQLIAGFEVAQKFVHRNDTRWTGLADSVAKFLKLRSSFFVDEAEDAKLAILEDWPKNLAQDVFQLSYWERMKGYSELLLPLSVGTKMAQSLLVPTGSRAPKFISDMKTVWTKAAEKPLSPEVKEFGEALLTCLSRRCDKYINSPCNNMKAAVLDPSQSRFLPDYGVTADVIEKSWEAIVSEGLDEFRAMQKEEDVEDELDMNDALVRAQVTALRNFLLRSKIAADSIDPLQFYRDNVSHCREYAPLACRVASNLLGIPAGESHSERVFSWAGGFVTKLRNRLGDQTLQELVVLYDFFGVSEWLGLISSCLSREHCAQLRRNSKRHRN
jgi:hypothetical protein